MASDIQVIRFYKPYGVLTQFTDREGRPTLADFIDVPEIYAAGRLDMDSEGLLLLTNYAPLKTRLMEPKFEHPRTYWAQVEGQAEEAALQNLRKGVVIQGYKTKPIQARILPSYPDLPPRDPPVTPHRDQNSMWLEMTLTEGKNRQVRRMTAAVGLPTLRLIRVKVGEIGLEGLELGEWRALTEKERATLWKSVKLRP
jgi:23S rRNA pseudouridine2457 synthase